MHTTTRFERAIAWRPASGQFSSRNASTVYMASNCFLQYMTLRFLHDFPSSVPSYHAVYLVAAGFFISIALLSSHVRRTATKQKGAHS